MLLPGTPPVLAPWSLPGVLQDSNTARLQQKLTLHQQNAACQAVRPMSHMHIN